MRRRGRIPHAEQERYEAMVHEAHDYYAEGHSLEEVAEKFGWGHADSVASAFKRRGLSVRSVSETVEMKTWPQERLDRLEELLAAGQYATEIAEELGLSREVVGRKIRALGLERAERPFEHGTRNGYTHRGCRCEECTRANSDDYIRRARANKRARREPPKHGTRIGYGYYGCRCEDCTRANTEGNAPNARAYAERRKKASA